MANGLNALGQPQTWIAPRRRARSLAAAMCTCLTLAFASRSSAAVFTVIVEQSADQVAFAFDYSFTLVLGSNLFGVFSSDQDGNFGGSVPVSGTIEVEVDPSLTSIVVTSFDVGTTASIAGNGEENLDMIVESITVDLDFSFDSPLTSPLIPDAPGSFIYGGRAELQIQFTVLINVSIPGVEIFSTPFDVGPFVFSETFGTAVTAGVFLVGTDSTLSLQVLGNNYGPALGSGEFVFEGLPAGITYALLDRLEGDPFTVTWGDPDAPLEVVPEPSSKLLSLVAIASLALVARCRSRE